MPTNAEKTQNYFSSRLTEQQTGFDAAPLGGNKMQDQQSRCHTVRVGNSCDTFRESLVNINEISYSVCPHNTFQPNQN